MDMEDAFHQICASSLLRERKMKFHSYLSFYLRSACPTYLSIFLYLLLLNFGRMSRA